MALVLPYFTFNGSSSKDYGLWVEGTEVRKTPTRDVNELVIPGRNGSLLMPNNRWDNVDIVIHCGLMKSFGYYFSFEQAQRGVMSWLLAPSEYKELKFFHVHDTNDYYYRLGIVKNPINWKMFADKIGTADVTFTCRPEKFLESGRNEQVLESGDYLWNPSVFEAKPLIRVVGYGTIWLSNGTWITIEENSEQGIFIDCERMDAYGIYGQNLNNLVTVSTYFPYIQGNTSTSFRWENTITVVAVTPRWYEL